MFKMKHKSNLLELSSNSDLAGTGIPGPKALHGCHTTRTTLSFTWRKTMYLSSNRSVLALQMKDWELLCWVQHLPWTRCQDPYASGCNSPHQISLHRWTCHLYTIVTCEVTTLAHKTWNNSLKAGNLITKSFLSNT